MTIKEVSEKTGISIDNLRYYERRGLIPPVPRTESGIRNYDEMSIQWIEFVMRFKKAGVSLGTIREYIQLAIKGESTKDARRDLLIKTKAGIEEKMREMQETLDIINYKIDTYDQKCGPITNELIASWKVTPLYYFGMSTQIKAVIDRFHANNAKLAGNKKAMFLATSYGADDWTMEAFEKNYESILRFMNWDDAGKLFATGCPVREVIEQTNFPNKAYELGKSIQ
ncbi:MerR family transcriptional regulator [Thermoanaerobacterium sp. CMT5567-10]|uniref:MerR family transcriptional regulator n=1 Tax=Thermoanaerobacterium sp. CMT5567-10 TaxID=3061989 RepID=UPI0026DF3843|nr:MerR family transcriptional regulator [Thermoanaerobacterium sp. CMT5567-10]WKV08470.1 MerR family transcriptional regulator [Thermoanaerobacterium sp. CMT5567-10]